MVYSARSETRNVSANAASRRRFLKIGAAGISAPDSKVEVRVIATDEEAMIARHTPEAIDTAAA